MDNLKDNHYGSLSSLSLTERSLSLFNKNYRNSIADTSFLSTKRIAKEVNKRNSIAAITVDFIDTKATNADNPLLNVCEASSVEALQLYNFKGKEEKGIRANNGECNFQFKSSQRYESNNDLQEPEVLNIKKETSV